MNDDTKHVPDGDAEGDGPSKLVGGNIDKNLSGESQPGTTLLPEKDKDITGAVLDGDAADDNATRVQEPSQEELDEDMADNPDGDPIDEDDEDETHEDEAG